MFCYSDVVRSTEIPFYAFEVQSSKMGDLTKKAIILGVALAAISCLSLIWIPAGTAAFYSMIGVAALGAIVCSAALIKNYCEGKILPLPKARSSRKYHQLLDLNEERRYGVKLPGLLTHLHTTNTANLDFQTRNDTNSSSIYLWNGAPFSLEETSFEIDIHNLLQDKSLTTEVVSLSKKFADPITFCLKVNEIAPQKGDSCKNQLIINRKTALEKTLFNTPFWTILNQSLGSYMLSVLHGRYSNDSLGIMLKQRTASSENLTANTSYHVKGDTLTFGQLLELIEGSDKIAYLHAELVVDVKTNSGYLSWTSPQTKEPSLI